MRAGIACLLALASIASAQQTFPDPPSLDLPVVKPATASAPPAVFPPPKIEPPHPDGPPLTVAETILNPGTAVGQQHTLGLQLQFGWPTGVRAQYAVYHGGDYSILVEAFGGGRDSFWGDESVVGVGGRMLFTVASDGAKNALVVGPGIGVSYWETNDRPFLLYDPVSNLTYIHRGQTDRYFLNLDANIGWLHELSPCLGWEVGVNIGVRVGLSGHEANGNDISGKVSGGTVGVYTGLRY